MVLLLALIPACGADDIAITQDPAGVARIIVGSPATLIRVGETVQLTATAQEAGGNVLEGRSFSWSSGIGTVASVSPNGLVTGLVKGASEIRASTEGVTGSVVITVAPAPRPHD